MDINHQDLNINEFTNEFTKPRVIIEEYCSNKIFSILDGLKEKGIRLLTVSEASAAEIPSSLVREKQKEREKKSVQLSKVIKEIDTDKITLGKNPDDSRTFRNVINNPAIGIKNFDKFLKTASNKEFTFEIFKKLLYEIECLKYSIKMTEGESNLFNGIYKNEGEKVNKTAKEVLSYYIDFAKHVQNNKKFLFIENELKDAEKVKDIIFKWIIYDRLGNKYGQLIDNNGLNDTDIAMIKEVIRQHEQDGKSVEILVKKIQLEEDALDFLMKKAMIYMKFKKLQDKLDSINNNSNKKTIEKTDDKKIDHKDEKGDEENNNRGNFFTKL